MKALPDFPLMKNFRLPKKNAGIDWRSRSNSTWLQSTEAREKWRGRKDNGLQEGKKLS
jgi:hypothetical protein